MALTFPMSVAAFQDLLPIQRVQFYTDAQLSQTGLGSGAVRTAEVAPEMWRGRFSLRPLRPKQASAVAALIGELLRPGRSFFAYDPDNKFPAADPGGSAFGSATPSILAVDYTGSRVRLTGLPAGYQLGVGDHLSFQNGADAKLQALHRFSEAGVANGSGVTDWMQVGPHIEPGVGTPAVTLIKAAMRAVILPNDFEPGDVAARLATGISFGFRQTFQ